MIALERLFSVVTAAWLLCPEGRQGAVLTLVLAVIVHCLMLSYVLSYAVLFVVSDAVLSCHVLS